MHTEKPPAKKDYTHILGSFVRGKIDRPIGSTHPAHSLIQYPVNYGYVDGVMAADKEEQDIYLLGVDQPVSSFEGSVIAVIHRLDDIEDKWVVDICSLLLLCYLTNLMKENASYET